MKPTIFVSCGQVTDAEIRLGKNLVSLIEKDGRYGAFFAENQSSLEGVTQNILARLESAAGFVAVLHPRGEVTVPDNSLPSGSRIFTRASVWIEQEIAILALLAQVEKKKLTVQVYSKRGVTREGLRSYVMTNPHEFESEDEVLKHFHGVLTGWSLAAGARGVALMPVASRQLDPRDATFFTLRLAFHNFGDQQATDARVRMKIPMKFIRHVHIANETRRDTHLHMEMDRSWFAGNELFQQLYAGDTTRVVQEIHYYVDDSRVPTDDDAFEIDIRSGNAPAFIGRVPVATLQTMSPDERYMILPAVENISPLKPFKGA